MLRMLEAQAPAKQTATDTIAVLSSRLNASLIEDRRAAVLGLRSFANDYPASVASCSLHGLLRCLSTDLEDVDTIELVLDTLLKLLNHSPDGPEASEDISLLVADTFTQIQDNVNTLLDLLKNPESKCRFYALQLLQAILTSRPERTQECILDGAGAFHIVSTLTDPSIQVRNAGLLLLVDLTRSSIELQKLVAFESTFDRLFQLIDHDGAQNGGAPLVSNCLRLFANLVRQNTTNQTLFRESGCVPKLSLLLKSAYDIADAEKTGGQRNPERLDCLLGVLVLIRTFLVSGVVDTKVNQRTFERYGILQQVLDLAVNAAADPAVRVEALYTCADIIRGNSDLQAKFPQMLVLIPPESSNLPPSYDGTTKISILDALLDTVFASPAQAAFDIRLAACEGITAYFKSNSKIQLGFLSFIIQGYSRHDDDTNILATLVEGGTGRAKDPYRVRFAAVLVLHLIWDNAEAKTTLMKVSEGDADNGEEVITCIQLIAGSLVSSIERDEDWRVIIAYFMLLSTWLFEDAAAVNDFLEEGSILRNLIQRVSMPTGSVLVKGLAATLIGILYHYSTKDSPIPRRSLHEYLTSSMGRDNYLRALFNLRQHKAMREYGVPARDDPAAPAAWGELPPEAYFDATFVDFLNDNFSILSRALDRDPGGEEHEENSHSAAAAAAAARAEAEGRALELEGSVAALEARLAELEVSKTSAERERRAIEEALAKKAAELELSKASAERERRAAEETLRRRAAEIEAAKTLAERERKVAQELLQRKAAEVEAAKTLAERERMAAHETLQRKTAEVEAAKSSAERERKAAHEALQRKAAEIEATKTSAEREKKAAEAALKKRLAELELSKAEAEKERKAAEEACADAQSNVDALMTVLENSEDRRRRQKKRLKELGDDVSDSSDD